jgi:hypothetical protein
MVVAPGEVSDTFPEGVPVAALVIRMKTVVTGTVPLEGVKVRLPAYPEPDEVETSNPVGGVMVMFPVSNTPDAVKLWEVETIPRLAVKALNEPAVTMVGEM